MKRSNGHTAPGRHAIGSGLALCFAAAFAILAGCEKPMDLGTLPQPLSSVLDTSYVAVDPPFAGFSDPEDILFGKDQLLYVADTKANQLVMLNIGGGIMSTRSILHPRSVSQDSRLDLLVGGEVVAASGDTVGAIFRVHLVYASSDSAHHLDIAKIDTVWREIAHPGRRFPGITVLSDNTYLAVRTGPDNSSIIDPDGRVLMFDASDRFVTPVPGLVTGVGSGIANINFPTSITAFPNSRDFIIGQNSEGVAYGALWETYSSTGDFQGWLPRFDPSSATDRFVDFIRPYQYKSVQAIAIDPSRRDVFIADAGSDSVFKFTSRGVMKSESFGYARSNYRMRRPTGLAFFQNVLYVADGEQGVIFRFRLSTDVPR
jgi:hypothetical protein